MSWVLIVVAGFAIMTNLDGELVQAERAATGGRPSATEVSELPSSTANADDEASTTVANPAQPGDLATNTAGSGNEPSDSTTEAVGDNHSTTSTMVPGTGTLGPLDSNSENGSSSIWTSITPFTSPIGPPSPTTTSAVSDRSSVSTTTMTAPRSTTTRPPTAPTQPRPIVTTTTTTTTTRPVATTTRPVERGNNSDGEVNGFVNAIAHFDQWTRSPNSGTISFINEKFDRMQVYAPFFDSRISWYDDGLAYLDIYAIYDNGSDRRATEHPEWILRDASGAPVYIPWGCNPGCPQFAADLGNPAFKNWIVEQAVHLRSQGYRGVFLDDVNLDHWFSSTPIDPRTGRLMTADAWERYMVEAVEAVRAAIPDVEVGHNAPWLADTPTFNDPMVIRQIRAADWIYLERGAMDAGLTNGDGTYALRTYHRYIDWVHSLGADVVWLEQSAFSDGDHEYSLANYLAVKSGHDLWGTDHLAAFVPETYWKGFDVDLGASNGRRWDWNGLIRRDFSGGMVLVNEPGDRSVTVTLPAAYRRLDGSVVTSVSVAGGRGVVLIRA